MLTLAVTDTDAGIAAISSLDSLMTRVRALASYPATPPRYSRPLIYAGIIGFTVIAVGALALFLR